MRAVNTGDDPDTYSGPSDLRNALQRATPVAVENLGAEAGNAEVTLTWDDLADYAILNYQYRQNDGSGWTTTWETIEYTVSESEGTATGTVSGLSNGTTYSFQVRGTTTIDGEAEEGPNGDTVAATPSGPPAEPEGLVATPGDKQVRLQWENPEDANIDGYQIRWNPYEDNDGNTITDFNSWADIDGSDATTTHHTVTGLTNGTPYTFEVRAIDSDRDVDDQAGDASSVTAQPQPGTRPPAVMVGVSSTVTDVSNGVGGKVTFSWDDPSDTSITKYQYRYKCETAQSNCDSTFGSETWRNAQSGTGTDDEQQKKVVEDDTFQIDIPGSAATVFFQLRAVGSGDGEATAVTVNRLNSIEPSDPPPPTPGSFSATADANGNFQLTWTEDTAATQGYQLRQSDDGGSTWTEWTAIPDSTNTGENDDSYTPLGLVAGTSYLFELRAVGGTADDPIHGAVSRAGPVTEGRPNPPTSLTAKPALGDDTSTPDIVETTNPNALRLSWTLPTEISDLTITHFDYRHRAEGNVGWSDWTDITDITGSDGATTRAVITRLVASTSYDVQIRAVATINGRDVGGEASTAATAKTAVSPEPIQAPAAPTGLTAAAGNAQVSLSWVDPGNTNILRYRVRWAAIGEGEDESVVESEDWQRIDGSSATTTTYTVTPLDNDIEYAFQVQAVGSGDSFSEASNTAAATPRPGAIPDDPLADRVARVNETVLPQVARAMAASALEAVTGRIVAVASGNVPAATVNIAGQSSLYHALQSNAQGMQDGTFDLAPLLGGSSFALSLNAAEGGKAGRAGNIGVWGSGDYRSLSGGDSSAVEWDGDVVSGHLGADARLHENLLAGLSASFSKGEFDYTDGTTGTAAGGTLESRLTSVNPYVSWFTGEGLRLWATAGYGWGELEFDDDDAPSESSGLTQWSGAAGVSGTLVSSEEMIEGGTTRLKLKGEGSLARVDVEGNGAAINEVVVDVNRLRLGLEGSHAHKLSSGGTLTPGVELGLRQDGGDGETGAGVELGGSLRYHDPASGLTVAGHGRTLLAHGGNYEEWGIGGLIRLDPGAAGRGMSLSLIPAWGETHSGVQRLWNDGVTDRPANDDEAQGRLEAQLGYGFGVFGGTGVLTPYSGLSLAGEGAGRYTLGSRLEIGSSLNLSFEGERRETAGDAAADHGVMLRGQLRF